MASLQDQIDWEKECAERITLAYYEQQDRLREQGKGGETDVMSYLLRKRIEEVCDTIIEDSNKTVGFMKHYNSILRKLIDTVGVDVMAFIGLRSILSRVREQQPVVQLAVTIGMLIESELKCKLFEANNAAYFQTVKKSLIQQRVTDPTHLHRVYSTKFKEFGFEWNRWTPTVRAQVGMTVVNAIVKVFEDLMYVRNVMKGHKRLKILDTTVEFDTWAGEFEKAKGLMQPNRPVLKIPPRPWDDSNAVSGGYYTPRMFMSFIKTKSRNHEEYVRQFNPIEHQKAVNKLQRTAWRINQRVLRVQEEVYRNDLGIGTPSKQVIEPPPFPAHLDIPKDQLTPTQQEEVTAWKVKAKLAHGLELTRKGKVIQFANVFKTAKEVAEWDEFYYAYTCDFRGRIYCCTSGLSPQGADTGKGLIHFAKGVVLGRDGIKWLAIHGANTFGNDKGSYDERVAWVHENKHVIQRIVEDPISNREWGEADKPYQFLAFCFEWADCDYGNNPNHISHLPVGLDGSCNGLQHFSAMLRDEVGAKATNLIPVNRPSDIYQEVADVCTRLLETMDDPRAKMWLDVGVSRKCAKRPVMTLPYGAKQDSCRTYILEYVIDNWPKFKLEDTSLRWDLAVFLSPILWDSIGEVVIAAREAMKWVQDRSDGFVQWVTPIGFPVFQYYTEVEAKQVKTNLMGNFRMFVGTGDETKPCKRQHRNGIAPNFVHSLDSTHLVMTVNSTDFTSYAMIHDDFGTHAGYCELLSKAIRKSFLSLYENHDPLEEWADQLGYLSSELPRKGKYNIKDIMKADYFFG